VSRPPDSSSTDTIGLRLLSATRGRERWEVRALRGRPDVAHELKKTLLQHAGVLHVHANPVSSRVLIFYIPGTPGLNIQSLVQDFLSELPLRPTPGPRSSTKASPLSRVLRESIPDRRALVTPSLLSIVGNTAKLLKGLSFVAIVNIARGEGPNFLRSFKLGPRLLAMSALSLLLTAADTWLHHLRRKSWRRLAQTTQHQLRTRLINKIETQDIAFFDEHGTGQLINLVTRDTERIGEFVQRAGDDILQKAIVILVSGISLLVAAPSLALLACIPLPFILLSTRFFGPRAAEQYARVSETSSRFSQILENNLVGIADVKSFTAEKEEARRLSDCDLRLSEFSLEAETMSSRQSQFAGGVFSAGYVLTAGFGGVMVAREEITQSEYIRVFYWFPMLLEALTGIEGLTKMYHGASESAKRLAEVLESQPQIRSGPVRLPAKSVRGEIRFEDVCFGCNHGVKLFENISFTLRPGETLAIVGPTGSGKSTLLRLLVRFFEVDSGRILLDGRDIRELNLQSLRRSVSLVSQDVHLFQGTVRENILYGQHHVTEEELLHAMRDAGALDLLDSLPGGLNAMVGERGGRLSGGERQRVAIARALLKLFREGAILALDEATSHLDNETEAAVKKSLRKAAKGKSVIMIAHRLTSIRHADRIIVLERGKIIEQGNHEQLLARKGLYASLWNLQNDDTFGGSLEVRLSD
jgi:ATP-binding cassette subfamily B protein